MEMKPKDYIKKVEQENPVEEPWEPDDDFKRKGEKISNKTHRSKTDPQESQGYTKGAGNSFGVQVLKIVSFSTKGKVH